MNFCIVHEKLLHKKFIVHLNKGKKTNYLQACATSITKIKHYLHNWSQFLKYICKKDILMYQTLYIQMVAEQMNILRCYCDENFVFSFPVFLSVISYLDPKFHESAKFFTI